MGVGGQRHALTPLLLGKTQYPFYRRLGGPQGRSGQMWKISPPSVFDPRTVQPIVSHYTNWAIPARVSGSQHFKVMYWLHPLQQQEPLNQWHSVTSHKTRALTTEKSAVWGVALSCWTEGTSSLVKERCKKNGARMCKTYQCKFCLRKMKSAQ